MKIIIYIYVQSFLYACVSKCMLHFMKIVQYCNMM